MLLDLIDGDLLGSISAQCCSCCRAWPRTLCKDAKTVAFAQQRVYREVLDAWLVKKFTFGNMTFDDHESRLSDAAAWPQTMSSLDAVMNMHGHSLYVFSSGAPRD